MNATELIAFKRVITTPTLPELGPASHGGTRSVAELNQALEELFLNGDFSDERQQAARSAALLWHDHLDASHHLSQSLADQTGSFLHAIMHRREPDYANAK